MALHHVVRKTLAATAVLLAAGWLTPACAQQFVSIKGENVNLRAAPGTRSEVLWQLGSGFPLKVVARKGNWLRVVDFEDDQGWVARRLTSTAPYSIVKSARANLRSGPGTRYRIVGSASYGEVFRVLQRRQSWVQVRTDDARKGWIARRLLWGK